jgi:non-reducing end alpha-L-arabinofuranosidase
MRVVLDRPVDFFDAGPQSVARLGLFGACLAATLAVGCSGGGSLSGGGSAGDKTVGGTTGNPGGATGIGGATSATGGAMTGGAAQTGGNNAGGAKATGGAPATGGRTNTDNPTGGAAPMGGQVSTGGVVSTSGASATGGTKATGGASATGGTKATGGASATGGTKATGGASATGGNGAGGASATGGTKATGGASATGGNGAGGSSITGPCDIYLAASTPCVAAHSTTRALFGAYSGNLYQVRRASDKTVKDIPVASPGGYALSSTQDSFCSGTTCTISIIYDQTSNANHLTKAPAGGWLNNGGLEANATQAKITLNGHSVYGIYTTSSFDNDVGAVGYRNNTTKGMAVKDEPEGIYMVASGKHYNQWCCFDYGNAETNNKDNGPGTMEAVYFGVSTQWGKGSGSGPWVMADLEDGVYAGDSFSAPASNTSLSVNYVTAMLKGKPGNFALKGGDAQSGALKTMWDGKYPSGYSPMSKEGAIILGIGGDNSHTGEGTFFEGCITSGYPTDAADDAVQANIVAAGYGK